MTRGEIRIAILKLRVRYSSQWKTCTYCRAR